MSRLQRLANATSHIDERFLLEALEYKHSSKTKAWISIMGTIAASVCILLGVTLWGSYDEHTSISVYASDSNQKLKNGEPVLMTGTISDSGSMRGTPLLFYILGNDIESIRFSCKNQWISFMDWTEQRDDYGWSKNFTIPYGEKEEEYYYLTIDWSPNKIIRKLTDNKDSKISTLTKEEKEDIIVMEIRYLNGDTENAAIWIRLEDNGQFVAYVAPYQISEEDSFIFQPDNFPIGHPREGELYENRAEIQDYGKEEDEAEDVEYEEDLTVTPKPEEDIGILIPLSEEEMQRIDLVIQAYYKHINQKLERYEQVDSSYHYMPEYEGYKLEETVIFRVYIEYSEPHRFITIGSTDGWYNCSVLNEGY